MSKMNKLVDLDDRVVDVHRSGNVAAVAHNSAPSPPNNPILDGGVPQQPPGQSLTQAILKEIQTKYDKMQQFCHKL